MVRTALAATSEALNEASRESRVLRLLEGPAEDEAARAKRARAAMTEQLRSMAHDCREAYLSAAKTEAGKVQAAMEAAGFPDDARRRFRVRALVRIDGRIQEEIERGLEHKHIRIRRHRRLRTLEYMAELAGVLPKRERRIQPPRARAEVSRKPSKTTAMLSAENKAKHRARRNRGKHAPEGRVAYR